jgi:membrane protein implicated in regulation of membrane protease activity
VLLIAACLLALLSPLTAGRWSRSLLLHRWSLPWTIWAALGLQVVLVQATLPGALAPVLHVATYAVGLLFLLANRRTPGVLLVAGGAAVNGVTIALNGGVLPASPSAVAAAGLAQDAGFDNSAVLPDAVLPWLGDVAAWPAPLPLANTFSVGDVLIVLGVVVAAWSGTQRLRRAPEVDPDRDAATDAATPAAV